MGLTRREVKPRRVAQSIYGGVDFCAQPSPAAAYGLDLRSPPFAPELCWWARTIVASIITYSLSASCDSALKIRSHTPDLLQREWRRWITRKSPKRSGRSRHGMPARYRNSTASTNSRLSFAVTPTCPGRPGRKSLMRSHWSSLRACLRSIVAKICRCDLVLTPQDGKLMTGPNHVRRLCYFPDLRYGLRCRCCCGLGDLVRLASAQRGVSRLIGGALTKNWAACPVFFGVRPAGRKSCVEADQAERFEPLCFLTSRHGSHLGPMAQCSVPSSRKTFS